MPFIAVTIHRDVDLTVLTSLLLILIWTIALKRPSACPFGSALLINFPMPTYLHIPLYSPTWKLAHYHWKLPFIISDRSFFFPLFLCMIWHEIIEMKCQQWGGHEGQCYLPGPLINWLLKPAVRWPRESWEPYQKAMPLQAFVCWVINLAVG